MTNLARSTVLSWTLRTSGALLLGGSAFAQSLVSGGVVRGTIAAPGEKDTYTFQVGNRDRFSLRLVDAEGSAFSPRLELFNPDGLRIQEGTGPDIVVVPTMQVQRASDAPPGTYTVVVSSPEDARNPTGTYDLNFVKSPSEGVELLDGVTVFDELEPGDFDVYTFTAGDGQFYQGSVDALPGEPLGFRVEKLSPSGYGWGQGGNHFSFSGSSNPGGLFTLVISDASTDTIRTGRYTIVVHGTTNAPPYPPSVFWPGEGDLDPLLFDNGGQTGLGPKIGDASEPFNVAIDCSRADAPASYVLAISAGFQSALSTPRGWLYLDGPRLLTKFGTHTRSLESWFDAPAGLLVPNDLALVGTSYTVQGGCGGFDGSMRLSGAITQTIGQ
ncbi:MAG: hypothetical protein ABL998_07810 [Planctomycetota bacterium]